MSYVLYSIKYRYAIECINGVKVSEFEYLEEIIKSTSHTVTPPERLTVWQSAEKYRYINNQGSYVGPWKQSMVPYTTEIYEELLSDKKQGVVFVTSAQSSKTEVGLNFLVHSIVSDPSDFMIVCPTMSSARDFSIRRIEKLMRDSPLVGERALGGFNDNIFDKRFKGGNLLTISWPTIAELSGKPIPRIALTDYDRFPIDIGGEGTAFDLASKRTTSFRRRGMVLVESTPGFDILDPKWEPSTPHEAPPTHGILEIYNRGDRRRWYWVCVDCNNAFIPSLDFLYIPEEGDPLERASNSYLACPHCGSIYEEEGTDTTPSKLEMNREHALWIPDNCHYNPKTKTWEGKPPVSDIASFWMNGLTATFGQWRIMIADLIRARETYDNSGDEGPLKVCLNTHFGMPFLPKHLEVLRTPDDLQSRTEDISKHLVPDECLFLTAAIDVHKRRFIVQVHGHAKNGDIYVIDRFDIKKSNRTDGDGDRKPIRPDAYEEDWYVLIKEVILRKYMLADGSGEMGIRMVVCDSGGTSGTTTNAIKFYRFLGRKPSDEALIRLVKWEPGLRNRFMLVRGTGYRDAPRVKISYPDSSKKDKKSGLRGDVPIATINVDIVKDTLNGKLDRQEPGGRIVFPDWLPHSFFEELCVEVKDPRTGRWENTAKRRNEAWDLLVYTLATLLLPGINVELINWDRPPVWATREPNNPYITFYNDDLPEEDTEAIDEIEEDPLANLRKLGEDLA